MLTFPSENDRFAINLPTQQTTVVGRLLNLIRIADDFYQHEGEFCCVILGIPRPDFPIAPYRLKMRRTGTLRSVSDKPIIYHRYARDFCAGIEINELEESTLSYLLSFSFRATPLNYVGNLFRF